MNDKTAKKIRKFLRHRGIDIKTKEGRALYKKFKKNV